MKVSKEKWQIIIAGLIIGVIASILIIQAVLFCVRVYRMFYP